MATNPISEGRLAANRANARRSTGPRTPNGKTRSSQNARKHGLTASKFAVVQPEELDELASLRACAIATYRPANAQQLFAVERIATAQQALRRCAALEAGLFTAALNEATDAEFAETFANDIEVAPAQDLSFRLAVGFQRMCQKSDSFKLFLRYQAQSERLYRRAVEEFERLKSLRPEFPNEPTADPNPERIPPSIPANRRCDQRATAPKSLSRCSPQPPCSRNPAEDAVPSTLSTPALLPFLRASVSPKKQNS